MLWDVSKVVYEFYSWISHPTLRFCQYKWPGGIPCFALFCFVHFPCRTRRRRQYLRMCARLEYSKNVLALWAGMA